MDTPPAPPPRWPFQAPQSSPYILWDPLPHFLALPVSHGDRMSLWRPCLMPPWHALTEQRV